MCQEEAHRDTNQKVYGNEALITIPIKRPHKRLLKTYTLKKMLTLQSLTHIEPLIWLLVAHYMT